MFPTTSKKQYVANALNVPFASLSESYLRAEVATTASQSAFNFQFQQSQNSSNLSSQLLLKQNDLFIVTHISALLKKVTTSGLTDSLQGSAKLYNYPNPSIFVASGEADRFEGVFNGVFSVTIDRKVEIPALDCRNFLRIPDTQAGQINAAIAGPVTYTTPRDGFPASLYGYYPTDVFQFDGQQTINFNLALAGPTDLTASSQTNYVVCILKGYLAQDQAKKANARNV